MALIFKRTILVTSIATILLFMPATSSNSFLNLALPNAFASEGSVDPNMVMIELNPGDSYHVDKTVTTPTFLSKLDFLFLVDETESFADDIDDIRGGSICSEGGLAHNIWDDLSSEGVDFKGGVAGFRDFAPLPDEKPPSEWGDIDDHVYILYQDLTSDRESWIDNGICDLTTEGGGDKPEAQLAALEATTDDLFGKNAPAWRDDAIKVVVLLTDGMKHVPADTDTNGYVYPGPSEGVTIGALNDSEIHVIILETSDAVGDYDKIAVDTGGSVHDIDASSSEIANAMIDMLMKLNFDVIPDTSDCADLLIVTLEPEDGYEDISGESEVEFTEQIKAPDDAELGTEIHCTVKFKTEKGVVIAMQEIEVTIPSTASIHGMKWNDLNGNSEKDLGEPGIAGWQIELECTDDADNIHNDNTVTDADGNYWFMDIPAPNDCQVSEETRPDWTPTTDETINVSVEPGDTIDDINFGNFKDVTIMGEKWEDTDADGTDNAEPRLAGWEMTLSHEGEILELTTTTADGSGVDPLGKYTFGPLGPQWAGSAEICETIQPGWTPIHPGTDCIDITIESGMDIGVILPDDATDFGNLLVIEAEKSWTHTDYNWDEICEIVETSPDVFEKVCRPANIGVVDDDVLADPLDQDGDGDKYLVNAHIHPKNNKFQNTNPGAFYALTTVDVKVDVDGLTIWENYGDCTDFELKLLSPANKLDRAIKVAIADASGDVTELTGNIYDGIGGSITSIDDSSAHLEITDPIESGSTVYMLVKFQDDLKGFDTGDGIFDEMCHNDEIVEAAAIIIGGGDLPPPAKVTAEADLRITNQE